MEALCFLVLLALFHPAASYSPEDIDSFFKKCPPVDCGKLGKVIIPFTNTTLPENCAPFVVDDCNKQHQKIQLERGGRWYQVENISQSNSLFITDTEFQNQLNSRNCQSFNNLRFPSLQFASFVITQNLTLFKCSHESNLSPHPHFDFSYKRCENFVIYYTYMNRTLPSPPTNCSILQLPIKINHGYGDIFDLLTATFSLQVYWWLECYMCQVSYKGKCRCVDAHGKPRGTCLHIL